MDPKMKETPTKAPRGDPSYSGEAWTDARGQATILLPPSVRSHRAGFAYELTPIGVECAARVLEEITDDRFTIATDRAHVKVGWRVTPLRAG
jgi:hypothetical protein